MTKRTLAVMTIIETEDARLFPENLDVSTLDAVQATRAAVIANLPNVRRVVVLMDEEEARLMLAAHALAAERSGLEDMFRVPPVAYRAPFDIVPPFMPGGRRRH